MVCAQTDPMQDRPYMAAWNTHDKALLAFSLWYGKWRSWVYDDLGAWFQ